jgi:alkanesulfonate monooxygenase SsuD/methylene tetrahydromethanopterin reductase-like flavin-dependent oxidoreductase (luciferase family)
MRLGIQTPNVGSHHRPLTLDEITTHARVVEDAGFNGIWKGHHVPVPGDPMRSMPDPLVHLMLAGMATENLEIGTAVYGVPLGSAAELAQRVYTIQAFTQGRFTFGVGAGSQVLEYEHAGLSFEERFARLDGHMRYIRAIYETLPDEKTERMFERDGAGKPAARAEARTDPTVANQVGMPRTVLGVWLSRPQLKRAATQYDGWMGSAGPPARHSGWRPAVADTIKRYRDYGGKRAILTTVFVNLDMPEAKLNDDDGFHLVCGPRSAAERLHLLEELGYDDVILIMLDREGIYGDGAFTPERLDEIRSLLPVDDRDYRQCS